MVSCIHLSHCYHIFFCDCVPEMFVTSYSVTCCKYVAGKPGICFYYYCAVYDGCKYSNTFWLAEIVLVCLYSTPSHYHHCANLSEGIELIKYLLDVFVECVSKIKHILSVIHFTICGDVCFQFTHFSCDDWDNTYTLSHYHHQIRSMNYYPLFRVRSLNNGVRCMSFYILIKTSSLTLLLQLI